MAFSSSSSTIEQMEAVFPFTTIPTRPLELTAGEWGQRDAFQSLIHKQLKDLPFVTEDILFFSPGDRIYVLERQVGCSWWLGAIRMSKTASTESELRILKLQSAAAATSDCANSIAIKAADGSKSSKTGLTSRLAKHASQKWITEATELASAKLDTILKTADTSAPLLLPGHAIEVVDDKQMASSHRQQDASSPVRMLQSNQLPGNFNLERPYSLVDDGKLFLISTYGGGEEIYKIGYFYAPYCRVITTQKSKSMPEEKPKPQLSSSFETTTATEQLHKDPTQLMAPVDHRRDEDEQRMKKMLGLDVSDDDKNDRDDAAVSKKQHSNPSSFREILSSGGKAHQQDGDSDSKAQIKRLQDALFSEKSSFARAMQNQTTTSVSVENIRDELLKLTIQLRRSGHKSNRDLTLLQAEESVLVKRFLRSISQLDLHKNGDLRALVNNLASEWPQGMLEDVGEQLNNLGLIHLLKGKKVGDDEEEEDYEDETCDTQLALIHNQANAMKAELRRLGTRLEHVTARNEVLECYADEAPEAAPSYNCSEFFAKEEAAIASTPTPLDATSTGAPMTASAGDEVATDAAVVDVPSMDDLAKDPAAKRLLKKMGKRFMECEATKEDYVAQKNKIEKGLTKAAEAVKNIEEAMSLRKRRVEKQLEILEISKSLGSTPQWEENGRLVDSSVHASILKQYKAFLIHPDDTETVPFIDECAAALEKIATKSAALEEKLKITRAKHEEVFTEQQDLSKVLEEKKQANGDLLRTIAFVKKECASLSAAAQGAKEELTNIQAEQRGAEETCTNAINHWKSMKTAAAVELESMDARIVNENSRIASLDKQLRDLKAAAQE